MPTFGIAREQIYEHARQEARNPVDIPEGVLREITRVDPTTGQRMTTILRQEILHPRLQGAPAVRHGLPRRRLGRLMPSIVLRVLLPEGDAVVGPSLRRSGGQEDPARRVPGGRVFDL